MPEFNRQNFSPEKGTVLLLNNTEFDVTALFVLTQTVIDTVWDTDNNAVSVTPV